MARQHVHDRRAGRGGSGSVWISYSDMMAALVLMFVLFLVFNLHNYNTMMEQKTRELEEEQRKVSLQQARLDEFEGILIIQQGKLDEAEQELNSKSAELDKLRIDLDTQQQKLDEQTIILIGAQQELEDAKATLAARESQLNTLQLQLSAQQELFDAKTRELDSLVGVRTQIIQELSSALRSADLSAQVDPNTGDIMLESTVFFESNSYAIKPEGRELLNRFLPVYLSVLLRDEYRDYLGQIIVEGHTDSDGSYLNNLKLSQNRALTVVEYCLQTVSGRQQAQLQQILTAQGRSSSQLIYYADGVTENKSASRRVEFKFTLRDAEMIDEMNRILTMNQAPQEGSTN